MLKSALVPALCSLTSRNRVLFSLTGGLGATLHHWDIACVNWDGSVVESWWCNVLAKNSVPINQPAQLASQLDGYAVSAPLHSPTFPAD